MTESFNIRSKCKKWHTKLDFFSECGRELRTCRRCRERARDLKIERDMDQLVRRARAERQLMLGYVDTASNVVASLASSSACPTEEYFGPEPKPEPEDIQAVCENAELMVTDDTACCSENQHLFREKIKEYCDGEPHWIHPEISDVTIVKMLSIESWIEVKYGMTWAEVWEAIHCS